MRISDWSSDVCSSDLHGKALVLAGESQAPQVHALVAAVNARLAAPISYRDTDSNETSLDALTTLAAELNAGRVRALLMLDVNPVYDAPPTHRFGDALPPTGTRFPLGLSAAAPATMRPRQPPQA